MIYAPELEQVAPVRVFNVEHNYGRSYNVVWKVEDDVCARQVLKALHIRPAFRSDFEIRESGNLWNTRLGGPIIQILVTTEAARKLNAVDVAATRVLLD